MGVDRDSYKVQDVIDGKAPFYEPGLEELVCSGRAAGRLNATTSMADALRHAEVALICVGTPSERNGNLSLDYLRRVCLEIRPLLDGRERPLAVVIRSTVFPGTCEEVVLELLDRHPMARVVSNPEFLREGTAVADFRDPSLIVVGGDDLEAVQLVAGLYAALGGTPCLVSLRTAEMIKYACNAFHAVKISFANEIGTLAARLGVDSAEVMETLCRDTRLNVSPAYLKPGFAFGGSCLPKDLRALVYRAGHLDLELPMLESILSSNQSHLNRAIQAALALPARRIGIFGLAFKENTDDLRESPVVTLIEQLMAKGRDLCVYDPHIRIEKLYGSNLNFLLNSLPHIGRRLVGSLDELLASCDHVIIAQKAPAGVSERIHAAGVAVLDVTQIARMPAAPVAAG